MDVVAGTEMVARGATRAEVAGLGMFSLGALRDGASMSAIRSYGSMRVDLGLGAALVLLAGMVNGLRMKRVIASYRFNERTGGNA